MDENKRKFWEKAFNDLDRQKFVGVDVGYKPSTSAMVMWGPLGTWGGIPGGDDAIIYPASVKSTWWFFHNVEGKQVYFIEADHTEMARQFLFDEFGAKYDAKSFSSLPYTSFKLAVEGFGLTEENYYRKNSQYQVSTRTKDRKITRSENDGIRCEGCVNFFEMAIANLPGGKFCCWSCRKGV